MKTPVSNLKDSTQKEATHALLHAGRVRAVSVQSGYRLSKGADLDPLWLHEEIGASPIRFVPG